MDADAIAVLHRADQPPENQTVADIGSHATSARSDDSFPGFPELDCIRCSVPARTLALSEERAEAVGTGADRVLIASGTLDEETYLRALGASLGIAFEPLDGVPRDQCPLNDGQVIDAVRHDILPLILDDELTFVVAPRAMAARKLPQLIEGKPSLARRFRFTSAERLRRFVLRHGGKAMAERAADELRTTQPMLSAAASRRSSHGATVAALAMLTVAVLVFASGSFMPIFELLLAAVFMAWLGLRLTGAFVGRPLAEPRPALRDSELPVYTIMSALYREAASVDGLLAAIARLDYPPEKLDVIIAVEADDHETRAALTACKTRLPIRLVPVPDIGPRTKPKALNMALPFARGTFCVVYDAEDRPDRDQLRCALQAFRAAPDHLACVQARLCIDNTSDGWLARYFTAEYAGQFDVFLRGLAALALPLPLGGSSNHFRTGTLRTIGGWDAYNVTEDADLGIRLARFGYRTDIIDSTTYEEAPARAGAWLRQRTRWFKGWMQTWRVHMRTPRRLRRELGWAGFFSFQLMVGGNVLAALVHPLFLIGIVHAAADCGGACGSGTTTISVTGSVYIVTAAIGYFSSAFLGWLGLTRRELLSSRWVLMLTPLYWIMLSIAAWRALYQLVAAPYAWEKTEHGLAKSSRRATRLANALTDLERQLSDLKGSGRLATANEADNRIWLLRRFNRASRPGRAVAA